MTEVPIVGAREPCPCGSGRRYKACHGRRAGRPPTVRRPFEGLPGEPEWVALRDIVPAATAPLQLRDDRAGRSVTLATVLPMGWPAMVRADGAILLGLQVTGRSADLSADLGAALEQALEASPGSAVTDIVPAPAGPRLQDLLAGDHLEVTVHDGFGFWVEGVPDPDETVAASLERANASVVPTTRLTSVAAAYWARIGTREFLRWVLSEEEDAVLDALVRLRAADTLDLPDGLGHYVGAFRAHGLLVPVWDLPSGTDAVALEEPLVAFRSRLDEALANNEPLDAEGRRIRAGLIGRQVTLR